MSPSLESSPTPESEATTSQALSSSLSTSNSASQTSYTRPVSPNAKRRVEPYAYVRFCNERLTLKASLESLLPFFDKGVIAYHDPLPGIDEDGSVAIAQEFVKNNPGFRLVRYPFPVIYHNSSLFFNLDPDCQIPREFGMDSFANFALIHLKLLAQENGDYENAWLFKADVDHIFNFKSLEILYSYAQEHDEYDNFLSLMYCVSHGQEDMKRLLDRIAKSGKAQDLDRSNQANLEKETTEKTQDYTNPTIPQVDVNTATTVTIQGSEVSDTSKASKASKVSETFEASKASELNKDSLSSHKNSCSSHKNSLSPQTSPSSFVALNQLNPPFHSTQVVLNQFNNTFDHFFLKLTHLNAFTMVFIQSPDYQPDNIESFAPDAKSGLACFERAVFFTGIRHCRETYFLNSIHFNREKHLLMNQFVNQEFDNIYSKSGPINPELLQELSEAMPELGENSEFYQEPAILELMDQKLDYGYLFEAQRLGKRYGRQYFDHQELLHNPAYKLDNIIKQYNLRVKELVENEQISPEEKYLVTINSRIINIINSKDFIQPLVFREDYN